MDKPHVGAIRRSVSFFRPFSLKQRLISMFVAILLLVCIGIGSFFFLSARQTLRKATIAGAGVNLGYLMENIESRMLQCEELSNWILVNRNIERVLIRDYSSDDPGSITTVTSKPRTALSMSIYCAHRSADMYSLF
ncbi:MAG: hypothetical protein GX153_05760 [Clostridiaceae bacterium]|jgi:hypothetical protein|nr:hypothetical protein [Clostridiaceae bacterium]